MLQCWSLSDVHTRRRVTKSSWTGGAFSNFGISVSDLGKVKLGSSALNVKENSRESVEFKQLGFADWMSEYGKGPTSKGEKVVAGRVNLSGS